jgi:FdrA protein
MFWILRAEGYVPEQDERPSTMAKVPVSLLVILICTEEAANADGMPVQPGHGGGPVNSTVELRHGLYQDSVRLMQISQNLSELAGVQAVLVAMATPLNLDLLPGLGFDPVPGSANPNDMLVAIRAEDEDSLAAAQSGLDALLLSRDDATGAAGFGPPPPHTTASALRQSGAPLALISVPGPHAFVEAMDALRNGASVMVFSDNVTVGEEILLKEEGARRGLLVMGPDCGTAVVGGVGLGFANVVLPGHVGIVAASGTGAQQICALLDAAGAGVSAVLGTGGRDLSVDVAGRSTLQAMHLLDEDPGTELVVVLSKPPAEDVAKQVREAAAALRTPAIVGFAGRGEDDLTAVASKAAAAAGGPRLEPPEWPAPYQRGPRPGALRGLFSGGTLCDEAMVIAVDALGRVESNIPLEPDWALAADLRSAGHLMIDFGDDQLTQGRPHPMIDWSLRLDRLAVEAADPSCGVVLLDVVLGYGSHEAPAEALAPAIRAARDLAASDGRDLGVVVSMTGTSGDPQGLAATAQALQEAGASVHLSNAMAARAAVALVKRDLVK